jgi:DNA-directed RNA polymerase subunit M/transcription elongation factor TFIIS
VPFSGRNKFRNLGLLFGRYTKNRNELIKINFILDDTMVAKKRNNIEEVSQKYRDSSLETLCKKFSEESAQKYEDAIYQLSLRLHSINSDDNLDNLYKKTAYEKIGQLMCVENKKDRLAILEDIQNDVIGWDASVFATQFKEYQKRMDRSTQKPKSTKGVHKCKVKRCGSDEFYIWSAQTRSSDEGMSNFRQCARCGDRRKE